jgi:hypothetical protein
VTTTEVVKSEAETRRSTVGRREGPATTEVSFSIHSCMQLQISDNNRVRNDMTIWKLKILLKIKIFMWYLK